MAGAKTIFYLLSNAAAVTAIVGSSPKRIFPTRAPQDQADPYIVYGQIGTVPADTKDGVSGFDKVDYDVTCYHKDVTALQTLVDAVRTALDFKTETGQGETVERIRFVRDFNGYDEQAKRYTKVMQFRLIVIR